MSFPPELESSFSPVRELSRGGFGSVWLAQQESLERTVAVKLLHSLEDPVSRQRFRKEAVLTALLRHPNIVEVIDHGEASGVPWIAYEFIPGRSVRGLVSEGEVPLNLVLEIGIQVAAVLEHAHEKGILHRDIKPDNILEALPGHYKVCDFGIGRYADSSDGLTEAGYLVGTPAYMSPQQITGEIPTMTSDVYSLGSTLYELLTGQTPFQDPSPRELLGQKLRFPPPDLLERRPDVPPALAHLVRRALSTRREDRFASAREMRVELESLRNALLSPGGAESNGARTLASDRLPAAVPGSDGGRTRRIVGAVAGCLAAMGAFWIFGPAPELPVKVEPSPSSPSSPTPAANPVELVSELGRLRARMYEIDQKLVFRTPLGLSDARLQTWESLVDRTHHAFEVRRLLRDLTDFLGKYPGGEPVHADWLKLRGPCPNLEKALRPLRGILDQREDIRQSLEDLRRAVREKRGPVERDIMLRYLDLVALDERSEDTLSPSSIAQVHQLQQALSHIVPEPGEEAELASAELDFLLMVLEELAKLEVGSQFGLGGPGRRADLEILLRESLPMAMDRFSELLARAGPDPSSLDCKVAETVILALTTQRGRITFEGVTKVTSRGLIRRAQEILSAPGARGYLGEKVNLLERASSALAQ